MLHLHKVYNHPHSEGMDLSKAMQYLMLRSKQSSSSSGSPVFHNLKTTFPISVQVCYNCIVIKIMQCLFIVIHKKNTNYNQVIAIYCCVSIQQRNPQTTKSHQKKKKSKKSNVLYSELCVYLQWLDCYS